MSAFLLVVALAAMPAPAATPLNSGHYTLQVPAGHTKAIPFPIPGHLVAGDRPLTFTWNIIRPVPAPKFLFMEQCVDAYRCYTSVMRPTGQASGTLQSRFRIINRSRLDLQVLIRYALWEAR